VESLDEALTLYEAVNESVLSCVPVKADRVLDIGCGSGALGERIRRVRERKVVGITYSQREAEMASRSLSEVICADLNQFDVSSLGQFDCVIMSHILEHLYSPQVMLDKVKRVLGVNSVVVVALPNVLFWKQRLEFLMGRWRYQDGGILDRTHFRFFDHQSAGELLEHAGYEIVARRRDGAFPLTGPVRKMIGSLAGNIDQFAIRRLPGLFATQFVYQARSKDTPSIV
jgi:SAM-dependent methyltransferase